MKRKKYLEEVSKLKKRFGSSWRRRYRVRKNYPFGKKSDCEYTIEEKVLI